MDSNSDSYDLLVVGAGINGAGIARDAAGRGLRVLLCEQDDLASHTSSSSTKLIHGGLRYLEYYDFGLVRKSLREREIILAAAPHIVWPMRFILPHDRHLRPAWMIRAGLFLYDHLAKRRLLPDSRTVDLHKHPAGVPLNQRYRKGFEYSDGWVDDARLVILTALDASEHGADVLTRTRCTSLRRNRENWVATLTRADGAERRVMARVAVNATGPWVAEFLDDATPVRSDRHLRLIKGSHIVVPRLFDHEYAYIFQAPDGRIVFAIPYEGDFTLLGTTEEDYEGDLGTPAISENEIDYLLAMANRYFSHELTRKSVVWTFAGLRPLLASSTDDPKSVTRDYLLALDENGPPLLSVFGGKITTYRKLAQDVIDRLANALACRCPHWTASAPLPGGDMPDRDFERFLRDLEKRYGWLPPRLRHRYARGYGTRIDTLLEGLGSANALGEEILPGLYQCEVDYLRRQEWAVRADDILWRRTKLGLHLPPGSERRLDEWLLANPLRSQLR
jgi:glycerol-3-phosphate dehydrogenase